MITECFPADSRRLKDTLIFAYFFRVNLRAFKSATFAGNAITKQYQLGLYKVGIPIMVFTTPDINKEYERLLTLGVQFRKAPVQTKEGIEALFEDGFGNIILLYEV